MDNDILKSSWCIFGFTSVPYSVSIGVHRCSTLHHLFLGVHQGRTWNSHWLFLMCLDFFQVSLFSIWFDYIVVNGGSLPFQVNIGDPSDTKPLTLTIPRFSNIPADPQPTLYWRNIFHLKKNGCMLQTVCWGFSKKGHKILLVDLPFPDVPSVSGNFQGPPRTWDPLPILFPYHSHKNP